MVPEKGSKTEPNPPGIAMDPWVATTLLAEGTRRARVAVCVTNLVTRHPAVAAASIASIDLLAPGRAVLGVGVGHSGTRNLGAPSLPARELAEGVAFVKESSCAGDRRPTAAAALPAVRS